MTNQEAQNKAIVRRFYEAFSANDQAAMKDVLAHALVAYTHGDPNPASREAMLQTIRDWNAAFETNFTIEEQIAEGDKVTTHLTTRAIHNGGEYMGLPATGKQAEVSGISIERIKDGKIMEQWFLFDQLSMMRQLGLVPPPEASR